MMKVFEISVAPQKNFGGFVSVCINATIQGKEPRVKFFPPTISPDSIFGTPQASAFLLGLLNLKAEDSKAIAHTAITIKIFLIIVFFETSKVKIKFLPFRLFNCSYLFSGEITYYYLATGYYLKASINVAKQDTFVNKLPSEMAAFGEVSTQTKEFPMSALSFKPRSVSF